MSQLNRYPKEKPGMSGPVESIERYILSGLTTMRTCVSFTWWRTKSRVSYLLSVDAPPVTNVGASGNVIEFLLSHLFAVFHLDISCMLIMVHCIEWNYFLRYHESRLCAPSLFLELWRRLGDERHIWGVVQRRPNGRPILTSYFRWWLWVGSNWTVTIWIIVVFSIPSQ